MTEDLPELETVRRLESPRAKELAAFCEVFDDLQTSLRCCEWLVNALVASTDTPAAETDLLIETVWTTALLSYGRCFAVRKFATVTVADLTSTQPHGDVVTWHEILVKLRDHHSHPSSNPREIFSVGVAQQPDGAADGIALTSAHRPPVDLLTVRQLGAIAYGLGAFVDERIGTLQAALLEEVRTSSRADLESLSEMTLVRS